MASIDIFGPYFVDTGPDGLQPGAAVSWVWGPDDRFGPTTSGQLPGVGTIIRVSGFGFGDLDGEYVVAVRDAATSDTVIHVAGRRLFDWRYYATFVNAGARPITVINAYISIIKQ